MGLGSFKANQDWNMYGYSDRNKIPDDDDWILGNDFDEAACYGVKLLVTKYCTGTY